MEARGVYDAEADEEHVLPRSNMKVVQGFQYFNLVRRRWVIAVVCCRAGKQAGKFRSRILPAAIQYNPIQISSPGEDRHEQGRGADKSTVVTAECSAACLLSRCLTHDAIVEYGHGAARRASASPQPQIKHTCWHSRSSASSLHPSLAAHHIPNVSHWWIPNPSAAETLRLNCSNKTPESQNVRSNVPGSRSRVDTRHQAPTRTRTQRLRHLSPR